MEKNLMETRTIDQWLKDVNPIIITGPNGQHKTRMLSEYKDAIGNKNHLHIDSNTIFSDLTVNFSSLSSSSVENKTNAIYQAFVLENEAYLMNYFSELEITILKKFKVDNDSQSIKKKIIEELTLLELKKVSDQTGQPDLNLEAKADAIFKELFINQARNFEESDNIAYEIIIRHKQTINKKIRDIAKYLEFSKSLHQGALLLQLLTLEYVTLIKQKIEHVLRGWEISELFTFHNSHQRDNKKLSLDEFIRAIKNTKFREECTIEYARKESELDSFLKEFNAELKEIDYKYRIDIQFQDIYNPKILFTTGNVSIDASELKLSSGEKAILSYLIWRHVVSKVTNIEYMLLDEPDRHLDPKLCKQFIDMITKIFVPKGINVIMTTHRIDTVALSPKHSIFKICKHQNHDSEKLLKPIHRLEALFRMTANMRSVTNLHYAVYTESVPDAYFYAGVYFSLRKYSRAIREKQKDDQDPNRRYIWNIKDKSVRILSERCQLSFYPTISNDRGGGGGISQVVTCLIREISSASHALSAPAQNELNSRWLFGEPGLHSTYGLLDYDGGQASAEVKDQLRKRVHTGSTKTKIENNIIYTNPRNCLEHYAYDPFVFYSAFKDKKITDEITIENLESENKNLFDFLKNLETWIVNLKNASDDQEILIVNQYFEILKERLEKNFDETTKKHVKTDSKIKTKYEASKKALEKKDYKSNIIIKGVDQYLEVNYPTFLLEMDGHILENVLFDINIGRKFTEKISENILYGGLNMIPFDLADIIFRLNERVRQDVRMAIGKDSNEASVVPVQPK